MNRDVRWRSVHREYLRAAYEQGELKDRNGVPPAEILELLRLTESVGDQVLEFLVDAGMIVWPAKGELMLTELGLTKAEELERTPKRLVTGSPHQDARAASSSAPSLATALGPLRAAGNGEAR